jgi:hypothetical protein
MRSTATGVLLAGIAAAAPGLASAQQFQSAEPYPGNTSGLVRCESSKGRPRTCKAETRAGVRVAKQLS